MEQAFTNHHPLGFGNRIDPTHRSYVLRSHVRTINLCYVRSVQPLAGVVMECFGHAARRGRERDRMEWLLPGEALMKHLFHKYEQTETEGSGIGSKLMVWLVDVSGRIYMFINFISSCGAAFLHIYIYILRSAVYLIWEAKKLWSSTFFCQTCWFQKLRYPSLGTRSHCHRPQVWWFRWAPKDILGCQCHLLRKPCQSVFGVFGVLC